MNHIAKAVAALDASSFSSITPLQEAAHRLAYTALRVVVLGSAGLDVVHGSARLRKETKHHSRKVVRQRLNREFRELRKLLATYPNTINGTTDNEECEH